MLFLKQSTAATIKVGPFVDKTDGVTPETGLTLTSVVKLSKNGGAFAVRNSASVPSHDTQGWYAVAVNTTDTNTVGSLQVMAIDETTFLGVWQEYMVLPANVYDSLVAGSDLLQADIQEINGSTGAADTFALAVPGVVTGAIVGSSSTATSFVTDLTEATNSHYVGGVIIMTSGVLLGQRLRITAYNGTTKALTVENRTSDVPSAGDTFTIN